ncbi:MAG: cell division protein FtsL [Hyphococcus sp.]
MIRISTLFLCVLLAAAAAGRYRAEVSVKETRAELSKLAAEKEDELRTIQMLRAEVAYLENPQRLAKIAESKTELRAPAPEQLLSAREFVTAMTGEQDAPPAPVDDAPYNAIANAIAMAQVGPGQ